MVDKIRFLVAFVCVGAGVFFYNMSDLALVWRILVILAGVSFGGFVLWKTRPCQRFFVFGKDAISEVKKVVWPTRKETIQTTSVVFVFVLIMAVFLWLTDKGIEWVLYDLVLGWKRS